MVSPWVEGGPLPTYLQRKPKVNRYEICSQIVEGVNYMHGVNMVHGDLKGNNVLISSDGVAKLIDFGNTAIDNQLVEFTPDSVAPTVRWAAPELLNEAASYSFATDVYALAMTILETVTGDIPFSEIRSDVGVIARVIIKRGHPARPLERIPIMRESTDALWNLLVLCWQHESAARPQMAVLKDGFDKIREMWEEEAKTILPSIPKVSSPRTTPPLDSEEVLDPNRISQRTSFDQIINILVNNGCPDLTSNLALDRCGRYPVQGGAYGNVHEGELLDGTKVALKVPIPRLFGARDPVIIRDVAKEMYIWSRCEHENIVRFLGFALFNNRLTLVSPWFGAMCFLPDYLFFEPTINRSRICTEIATGLEYLHGKNIAS